MTPTRKLWLILTVILLTSFSVLLIMGREIYRVAPPMPESVVTETGQVVYSRSDIETGRQVWQSMGGHQVGSIWGHGAYLAPDWSADWLHREAVALLDLWSHRDFGAPFDTLSAEHQAMLEARLQQELRTNTYDAERGAITISGDRHAAISEVAQHYEGVFSANPDFSSLRENYAIHENPIPDPERRQKLNAFFYWTAWAAVTHRPDSEVTYTNNWPADELVGNTPTTPTFMWTVISIVVLLAGVGALAWHHAAARKEPAPEPPEVDPLHSLKPTPSMKATAKYFWVVTALFVIQVFLGAITAHYAVEGQAFYGFNLSDYLPYAVTRTWHTQLAVLWIATAWLATGLYMAPAISGHEPRFQRVGVNFLFTCLLIIVVGAMAGQWLGVMSRASLAIRISRRKVSAFPRPLGTTKSARWRFSRSGI